MIPLLLDMGLARRAAGDLRALGWDVQHVSERGLEAATDDVLLHLAAAEARVIVTLDVDFSNRLARQGLTAPSVIHIRQQRLNRSRAVALLSTVVPRIVEQLRTGCVASVTEDSVRTHPLPIRPIPA